MSLASPRRSRCERGLASVEFTIALPVLLLLLLATAEIGRMLSQYDTLTKTVRDGARYLAAHSLDGSTGTVQITAQVQTQTQNLVVNGNINGTGSAVLPGLVVGNVTVSNPSSGYVSVSAVYTYQPMIGTSLPTFGLGSPISTAIPLTATVVMRAL